MRTFQGKMRQDVVLFTCLSLVEQMYSVNLQYNEVVSFAIVIVV